MQINNLSSNVRDEKFKLESREESCDWCNGLGLAWADCGDYCEPQKCDSCQVYESDHEVFKAMDSDIRIQQAAGVSEAFWSKYKWENESNLRLRKCSNELKLLKVDVCKKTNP